MGGARVGMMPLHCGPYQSTRAALSVKRGPNDNFSQNDGLKNRVQGSFDLPPRCLNCPPPKVPIWSLKDKQDKLSPDAVP